jgi:hypothetical protein
MMMIMTKSVNILDSPAITSLWKFPSLFVFAYLFFYILSSWEELGLFVDRMNLNHVKTEVGPDTAEVSRAKVPALLAAQIKLKSLLLIWMQKSRVFYASTYFRKIQNAAALEKVDHCLSPAPACKPTRRTTRQATFHFTQTETTTILKHTLRESLTCLCTHALRLPCNSVSTRDANCRLFCVPQQGTSCRETCLQTVKNN